MPGSGGSRRITCRARRSTMRGPSASSWRVAAWMPSGDTQASGPTVPVGAGRSTMPSNLAVLRSQTAVVPRKSVVTSRLPVVDDRAVSMGKAVRVLGRPGEPAVPRIDEGEPSVELAHDDDPLEGPQRGRAFGEGSG